MSLELAQIKSQAQDDTSKAGIEEFEKRLLDMLSKIEDSQKQHEEINLRMMTQCEAEFKFRDKEVKDADASYAAAEIAFLKCQDSKNQTTANLPPMQTLVIKYKNLIDTKTKERKATHDQYLSLKKDWKEATDFLGDFLEQIHNLQVGSTPDFNVFAQRGEDLLVRLGKIGKISDSIPIFVALSSLELSNSKRSENDVFSELNKSVLNLRAKMLSDSLEADVEEDHVQTTFQKLITNFNKIVDTLNGNIDISNKHLIAMTACVTSEGKIMSEASMKSKRNAKLKSLAQVTCGDFAKEFVEATKNRKQEVDVVNQIVIILKRRYGDIDHDVQKAINSTTEVLNEYKDNFKFVRYTEYIIHHTQDNLHGKELSESGGK